MREFQAGHPRTTGSPLSAKAGGEGTESPRAIASRYRCGKGTCLFWMTRSAAAVFRRMAESSNDSGRLSSRNRIIPTALGLVFWLLGSSGAAQEQAPVQKGAAVTAYNVHLVVTEEFLNRLIARRNIEPSPVLERMQEVWIQGQRCTISALRLDLRPRSECAAAQFILEGQVHSQTTSFTDQARIHSVGFQYFLATKDLFFDGEQFATRHAEIAVHSQNHPWGFETRWDGTWFSSLAQQLAAKRAEQRRPQSEAFARQKLTERVYPQFDSTVDHRLAEANRFLQEQVRRRLQEFGALPKRQRVQTTEFHLHYAAALTSTEEPLAVAAPRLALIEPHAITVYLHESVLNDLLERLPLRGWKTTNRQVRDFWQARGFELPPPELTQWIETQVELDSERPVRVELQDDRCLLRLRASLRPAGQNLLPAVEITLPLRLQPREDIWELQVGTVEVRSLVVGENLPGWSERLIQQAVMSSVPIIRVPRTPADAYWVIPSPKPELTSLRAADGWLAISFD